MLSRRAAASAAGLALLRSSGRICSLSLSVGDSGEHWRKRQSAHAATRGGKLVALTCLLGGSAACTLDRVDTDAEVAQLWKLFVKSRARPAPPFRGAVLVQPGEELLDLGSH
jgi:hypothetical protein